MTKYEMVYVDTLNLLGTVLEEPAEIQASINLEHALADPAFAEELRRRGQLASSS